MPSDTAPPKPPLLRMRGISKSFPGVQALADVEVAFDGRIIVMDEPTAALTPQEVDTLLKLVASLKEQGIGIIYISHRLEEIFRVADRIMVMRDGRHVDTRATSEMTRQQLIEMMV